VIKEAESFQLSSDCLMVAQDVEPDLFWRDFKVNSHFSTLSEVIQIGIGNEYSVDALEINTTGLDPKTITADDVVSQVGQKFLAKTNNIQKITLLLGIAKNSEVSEEDWYDWSGDFIVSIYPLQTTTSCPTDIIPNLGIDFDPTAQPLVQVSYNQQSLKDVGYVLTDILQPVDFIFNNTKIAVPGGITADKYYIVTVKRSGDASNGEFLIGCGRDAIDNSRVSLFNGSWVDIQEEDLWFQVWTDAIKIADGMGYDSGNGMQFNKTKINSETGLPIDNQVKYKSFAYTGETTLNIGILAAIEDYSKTKQNEKSGSPVNSLKQFIPQFSFVNAAGLVSLQTSLDPVIIGTAKDSNPKSNVALLEKIQLYPGLAVGDTFCIINPDADLLSLNLIGSKLIPNIESSNKEYRIFKSTFCTDGYGDLNGDGKIDEEDLVRIAELVGEGLVLESTQQKIADGYFDAIELLKADLDGDGYVTSSDVDLLNSYITKQINSFPIGSSFTHICLQVQSSVGRYDGYFDCDGLIRLDGYSGQNLVDPSTLTQAELEYDGYFIDQQIQSDPVFLQVPFAPVTYQIISQPFWQDYLVLTTSEARIVPAIFSDTAGIVIAELATAPLLFWGHSAGGEYNYEFACWKPERVMAFVVNKGGFYYTALAPEATRQVPGLFLIGENDMESRNDIIKGLFMMNRRVGALWAFGSAPGAQHEIGTTQRLAGNFFSEVLTLKSSGKWPGQGFIGDFKAKTITPAPAYKGNQFTCSWLATNLFANAWLMFINGIL
jgi:hypothetical protein